jgi:molybdopterin molybdotransferase
MQGLSPLATCLAAALDGITPVEPEAVPVGAAAGRILADDVRLTTDRPPGAVSLRPGLAVAALDLVGASPHNPAPLDEPVRVAPGMPMPPGTDAVLPVDGVEGLGRLVEAVRTVAPGEGVRQAGHDGRAGDILLRAGRMVRPQHRLAASLAGIAHVAVRPVRVRSELAPSAEAGFVADWLVGCGATLDDEAPHLVVRPAADHRARLALEPGDAAWLAREAGGLVLHLPERFDGIVAALSVLALPALATLAGAQTAGCCRPLRRKVTSTVGLAELVLLRADGDGWQPAPAGFVTLEALASAEAFAIIPPESEGAPGGTPLEGTPLAAPFG